MNKSQSSINFIQKHRSFLMSNNSVTAPILYRVYKSTVERQLCEAESLNSHAGYLLLLDDELQVLGWVGKNIDSADETLLSELGCDIMRRDYGQVDTTEFPIIYEIAEPSPLLDILLEVFGIPITSFSNKTSIVHRNKAITNEAVSVGNIIPTKDNNTSEYTFEMEEVSFAHPDSLGIVARVPFVYVEMNTIAYYQIGNQWDIWFARGVEDELRQSVILYIEKIIINILLDLGIERKEINHDMLIQYYAITFQGQERQCFRRILKIFTDFEPPGRTLPRPISQKSHLGGSSLLLSDGMNGTNGTNGTSTAKEALLSESFSEIRMIDNTTGDIGDRKTSVRFTVNDNNTKSMDTNTPVVDFWSITPLITPTTVTTTNNDEDTIRLHIPTNSLDTITTTFLEYHEEWNITIDQRKQLLSEAAINPLILLGWQIEIDDGMYHGRFIVIGLKKSLLSRKTLFHVAGIENDHFWIPLKRKEDKNTGIRFRPLRQVVVIDM